MFCDKCGAPIPEGMDTCPNCQSVPEEEVAVLEAEEVSLPEAEEVSAPEAAMELNFAPEEPAKKSPGKKIALIAGIALVVALIGVAIAWACGAFRTPQEQLLRMEQANVKLLSTGLVQGYDAYMQQFNASVPGENGFHQDTTYRLSMHEDFWVGLLEELTQEAMVDVDLSWLQNVLIRMNMDYKSNQLGMKLGLGLNDTTLATIDFLLDAKDGNFFLGIPELNPQYLKQAVDMSGVKMDLSAAVELVNTLMQELPDGDAWAQMLDRYTAIYLDSIQVVEKSTEFVSAGKQSGELTVLKVTYTQEQLTDLMVRVINTAKTDETLKQGITALQHYMDDLCAAMEETGPVPDLYQEFLDALEETLTSLEESRGEFDPANYMVLSNYVRAGIITGRKLEIFSKDETPICLYYQLMATKQATTFEAGWPMESDAEGQKQSLKLVGEIGQKESKCTCYLDAEELFTVKLTDWALEDDAMSGVIRLYPSEYTLKELGLSDSYSSMASLVGCCLEIDLQADLNGSHTTLSLIAGETLGQLVIEIHQAMEGNVTLPESSLDMEDETASKAWLKTLSLDGLVDQLEQIGLPNDYLASLRQVAAMLKLVAAAQ